MTLDELVERLISLRRWSAGGERAPHKPLLTLLALGRLQRGKPRLVAFGDIEDALRRLLEDFGPPRRSYHPEFPFWHLTSDGIWEVQGADDVRQRKGSSSPTLTSLRSAGVLGGFTPEVDALLRDHAQAIPSAAEAILEAYFPPSIHEDLLAAVGLDVRVVRAGRTRDPEFRLEVLRAYEYRCAACGYDGWLDTSPIGLDAAHVRWFAYGGPDELANALCLCALHHRTLDRGAISIDLERRIMVSRLFRGRGTARRLVIDLAGRYVDEPQAGLEGPADEVLRWHHREVFRGERLPATAQAAEDPPRPRWDDDRGGQ